MPSISLGLLTEAFVSERFKPYDYPKKILILKSVSQSPHVPQRLC